MPNQDTLLILLEQLEKEQDNSKQISQTMISRDLKKFGQKLRHLGEEYRYSSLLNYAAILNNQLQELDLENLPKTLKNFTKIIQKLQQLLKSYEID